MNSGNFIIPPFPLAPSIRLQEAELRPQAFPRQLYPAPRLATLTFSLLNISENSTRIQEKNDSRISPVDKKIEILPVNS